MSLHQNSRLLHTVGHLATVGLVTAVLTLLPPIAHAAGNNGLQAARVHTALVGKASGLTDETLEKIALSKGATELVWFEPSAGPDQAVRREFLRLGEPGTGYPGFAVHFTKLYAEACQSRAATDASGAATVVTTMSNGSRQYTLDWALPETAAGVISVTCKSADSIVGTTDVRLSGKGESWPRFSKTTAPGRAGCIVQLVEYISSDEAEAELRAATLAAAYQYSASAETSPLTPELAEDALGDDIIINAASTYQDSIAFDYCLTGLSYQYDSKWQPGSSSQPGGYPLQVRLVFGAGAELCASANGTLELNSSNRSVCLGNGSASTGFDLGVEFSLKGSLDTYVVDPFTFSIPYVPDFDLRVAKERGASSFLLDSTLTCYDAIGRQRLLSVDLSNLVLPVPGVGGGFALDAAVSARAQLSCDSISFSDGTRFTSERQCRTVEVCNGYHTAASYNERFEATATVTAYPSLYVQIAFWSWSLPIIDLPWDVYSTSMNVPFATSRVDFNADLRKTWYRDADGDGYGDRNQTKRDCSRPSGYVDNDDDCDDSDRHVYPGANEICDGKDNDCDGRTDEGNIGPTWYRDADGDGYGNRNITKQACSKPSGYVENNDDCNDGDRDIHPGATELCDGKDNDCDGQTDEGQIGPIWYRDADGDGFGSSGQTKRACYQPGGYVDNEDDCNDNDPGIHPGAMEIRDNGIDEDCDGVDLPPLGVWFRDGDADGYGDSGSRKEASSQPVGYVANDGDCNDNDASINPAAADIPGNGIDEDCDGVDAPVLITWYRDADGDGFGNPNDSEEAATQPSGYVDNDGDCDDTAGGIHPGAREIPDNGIDEDCDGTDRSSADPWYRDADGDGFGNPDDTKEAATQPPGYVVNDDDCDDNDPSINPAATEIVGNGIDENCDGVDPGADYPWYRDADGDGYGDPDEITYSSLPPSGYVDNGEDCDDGNPAVNPAAPETCNGFDDNCDGLIDESCSTWYEDADADGYGNPDSLLDAVDRPQGYVDNADDCDDTDADVNPAANEICGNGVDEDCSGSDQSCGPTWYRDADNDAFGDPTESVESPSRPAGYVANNLDCDDSNAAVHPAASEICDNGIDDNCDGLVDCDDSECNGGPCGEDVFNVNPTSLELLPEGTRIGTVFIESASDSQFRFNVQAASVPEWLVIDPMSGSSTDDGVAELRVELANSGLPIVAGRYTKTVNILLEDDATAALQVAVEVGPCVSDRDGDGVCDDEDLCPDMAGECDSGCPMQPVGVCGATGCGLIGLSLLGLMRTGRRS